METKDSNVDNNCCEYCNQVVSMHFKKLQLTPDAIHWIEQGLCGVLCSGKIEKGSDEEKKILEKITVRANELIETRDRIKKE